MHCCSGVRSAPLGLSRMLVIERGEVKVHRMRPSDDEDAYNSLFSDLVALERARRDLNDRAFRGNR